MICRKCNIDKENIHFYADIKMKNKVKSICIDCYKNLPSRQTSYKREYELVRKYNINIEQFDSLFKDQDSKCKLCNEQIPRGNKKRWCVDHCHKTGKIRGILCLNCNLGLGLFDDNTLILQKAIKYLNAQMVKLEDTVALEATEKS